MEDKSMNLRNAKKIIYKTLDEYNNTFNTNSKYACDYNICHLL